MIHKTAGVQQGVTAASPCKWSQVMLSVTLYQRWYAARSVTCHCSVSRQTKHLALREDPTSLFSFLKIYISCFVAGLYYMSYVCCMCTMCTYTMCMPDEFSWGTHHKDFSQGPTLLWPGSGCSLSCTQHGWGELDFPGWVMEESDGKALLSDYLRSVFIVPLY